MATSPGQYSQGYVRTTVVIVWGVLFLATLAAVMYFVLSRDKDAPTKSYLDLQTDVSAVAESSKEVAAASKDFGQARQLVTDLSNLALQADPKKGDVIKQNVAKIAQALGHELDGAQSRWDARAKGLQGASEKLQKAAGALGTALSSLQTEGIQWKAGLLSSLLWVMLLACLLIALFFSPDLFAMLGFVTGFVRGFKGLGFELSFAGEEGKQRNKVIRSRFNEAFAGLRHQATREVEQFVDHRNIEAYVRLAFDAILAAVQTKEQGSAGSAPLVTGATPPLGGPDAPAARADIRCTVHVPDLIFRDYLCQLVPYHPKRSAGGASGRAWAVFYGMIGRVWRSKKSELRSLPSLTTLDMQQTLISDYAMTREQVNHLHKEARSFLCLLLRHSQQEVGVLYMDAPESDVFGDSAPHSAVRENAGSFDFLLNLPAVMELAQALVQYREDLLGKAPRIEVMEA